MDSSNFIIKCKNCHSDLIYTLLPECFFSCFQCKHHLSAIYGVWHCTNSCGMDVCPLCTLQIKCLCKLCKGTLKYFQIPFLQEKNIYQCNECFGEYLTEDGGHRCMECKKYYCCVECRSRQNDLYNRSSEFYTKDFGFI
jgi:hypothetical protein